MDYQCSEMNCGYLKNSASLDPPMPERDFEGVLVLDVSHLAHTRSKLQNGPDSMHSLRNLLLLYQPINAMVMYQCSSPHNSAGQSALMDVLEASTPTSPTDHLCPPAARWIMSAARLLHSFPSTIPGRILACASFASVTLELRRALQEKGCSEPRTLECLASTLECLKDDPRLSLESRDWFERAEREMTLSRKAKRK